MSISPASYIDHTVLKEQTTGSDVARVCMEAMNEHFVAVCIPPAFMPEAKRILNNSVVKVATVIAFPTGRGHWTAKVQEITGAMAMGADELDVVIDLEALHAGNMSYLEEEIMGCLAPIKAAGKVIKVIVESGVLSEKELLACCELYGRYDIDYMKTSTGFAKVGATVDAVKYMRAHLPAQMGIKAAGGIRTWAFAKELIEAGATRLGCSASMEIMNEYRKECKTG